MKQKEKKNQTKIIKKRKEKSNRFRIANISVNKY